MIRVRIRVRDGDSVGIMISVSAGPGPDVLGKRPSGGVFISNEVQKPRDPLTYHISPIFPEGDP